MPKNPKKPVKILKQSSIKNMLKKKENFLNFVNNVVDDDSENEMPIVDVSTFKCNRINFNGIFFMF